MNRPTLYVSESVHKTLADAAAHAHPLETGGILLGVHYNRHPWVTRVVEIPTTRRGRTHYRIPQGATRPAVAAAREADPRLGYLGDWHTHPADVEHSRVDLASLRIISFTQPRTAHLTSLIAKRTASGYQLAAKRIVNHRACDCEIHYLGDLPAPNGETNDAESN